MSLIVCSLFVVLYKPPTEAAFPYQMLNVGTVTCEIAVCIVHTDRHGWWCCCWAGGVCVGVGVAGKGRVGLLSNAMLLSSE